MKRTEVEVEAEISALKELINKVPSRTAFGDSNTEAIDAQIEVLNNPHWEEWQVDANYAPTGDDDDDDDDGKSEHAHSAAMDALRWRNGESDEKPSDGWLPLVRK